MIKCTSIVYTYVVGLYLFIVQQRTIQLQINYYKNIFFTGNNGIIIVVITLDTEAKNKAFFAVWSSVAFHSSCRKTVLGHKDG